MSKTVFWEGVGQLECNFSVEGDVTRQSLLGQKTKVITLSHGIKISVVCSGIKLSIQNIFFTVTKVFRKTLVTLSQL